MRVAEPPKSRVKSAARAIVQVLSALKNSDSPTGPTMTQIVRFISKSLVKPVSKRQVVTALRRGVDFGILQQRKGHYLVSSVDESPVKLPAAKPRLGAKQPKLQDAKRRVSAGVTKPRRKRPSPKKLSNVESEYTLAE